MHPVRISHRYFLKKLKIQTDAFRNCYNDEEEVFENVAKSRIPAGGGYMLLLQIRQFSSFEVSKFS